MSYAQRQWGRTDQITVDAAIRPHYVVITALRFQKIVKMNKYNNRISNYCTNVITITIVTEVITIKPTLVIIVTAALLPTAEKMIIKYAMVHLMD